jgi:hypothetical protein
MSDAPPPPPPHDEASRQKRTGKAAGKAPATNNEDTSLVDRVVRSGQELWQSAVTPGNTPMEALARGAQAKRGESAQAGRMRTGTEGWTVMQDGRDSGASTSRSTETLTASSSVFRQTDTATTHTNITDDWATWSTPAETSTSASMLAHTMPNEEIPIELHPPRDQQMASQQDGAALCDFLFSRRPVGAVTSYTDSVYEQDQLDPSYDGRLREVAGLSIEWVMSLHRRWQQIRRHGDTASAMRSGLFTPDEVYLLQILENLDNDEAQVDTLGLESDILMYLDSQQYTERVYQDDLLGSAMAHDQATLRELLRDFAARGHTTTGITNPEQSEESERRRKLAMDRLRMIRRHLTGA